MKAASEKDFQYEECAQEEPGAPVDDGLEAALEKIGGNTAWMWMVFVMASAPGIFNIWALTSFVFLGAEVDHWCDVSEFRDVNWTMAQRRTIITGDPNGKSCHMPNYNYSLLASLTFEEAQVEIGKYPEPVGKHPCGSFEFAEEGTSVVEQWDLVCDRLVLLSNVQMVVALGKFVGALVFGFVADKWGRKCCFVISCIMYMVAGPIAGIFPVYELFVAARFILGMAGSGCYNCAFTLLTEVSNAERRTLLGILYNMSYPLGLVILALVAYLVPQWRSLQLATSIPALLLIINCWLIPESPRWLLSQGRRDEVWAIVKKADKSLARTRATNLSSVESTKMMDQTANTTQEEKVPWKKKVMASLQKFTSLLSNGDLCMRLLISQYMWCVTALSYFALSLNADNFLTDRYIYMAASGVVEAVSYVLPIPILSYVGRRHTSAAMYLLSGISLLSILAIPTDQTTGILVVAMVGRLCISAVYSVIILYTSELFPTENRNTAVGASSTMSHVGTILAPYIVIQLGEISKIIPSTLCALLSLSAGLLVLLLPETRGKSLPDTVEEMKENAKKGDKVSIKNCCSLT